MHTKDFREVHKWLIGLVDHSPGKNISMSLASPTGSKEEKSLILIVYFLMIWEVEGERREKPLRECSTKSQPSSLAVGIREAVQEAEQEEGNP